MLQRGNVEVSQHHDALFLLAKHGGPLGHHVVEAQFLVEFLVYRAVGYVTTRRNIEIMNFRAVPEFCRDMPFMARQEIEAIYILQFHAREDGDAVIAFLPADINMLIPKLFYLLRREQAVLYLDFL